MFGMCREGWPILIFIAATMSVALGAQADAGTTGATPTASAVTKARSRETTTAITGRVTDEDGRPIAGARLRAREDNENHDGRSGTTNSDKDGRFSIEVEPGKNVLSVDADGYVSMSRSHDVAKGLNPRWDFILPRGATLSGRVVDTKGRAVPRRVVELSGMDSAPPPAPGVTASMWGSATANDKGEFNVSGVMPGRYSVAVYRPSPLGGDRCMQQVPVRGRVIEADPARQTNNFEIVVNPAEDHALSGHVRDAAGKPMRGIVVDTFIPHGRHWWTKTDESGAFRLEGLDGMGMSSFKVFFNGIDGGGSYNLCIPDVPLNATNVDLVVPGSGSIHGVVRNAKTSQTLQKYQLTVPLVTLPESRATWEKPDVKIAVNPDGSFDLSGVPAGNATIEIRADGLGAQRFVTRATAGTTTPLQCEMQGPAVLAGRTTLNGKPEGIGVIVGEEWLNSDNDGQFRFDKFPNGEHTIWFFKHDGWHHSRTVTLKSGETTRVDVEMGGSCKVHGSVDFPDDEHHCMVRLAAKPAPDGWFEFGRPSPEEHVLTYAFIGKPEQDYKLENIPAGHYYVMMGRYRPSMHRSVIGACREVDLKEGESLRLDFDLTNAE